MHIVTYLPEVALGERTLGAGVAHAASGWARGLAEAGATVSLVYDPSDGHPDGPVNRVPIRHLHTAIGRIPLGFGRAARGGDIVMLHSAWVTYNVFAARAARRRGIPYITTPHGAYNPNIVKRRSRVRQAAAWAAERRVLFGARAVHLYFEEEAADARRLGYRGEFIVAPIGVEPPGEVRWDGGSGGFLLWIGVYDVHRKGLDLLLQALHQIPEASRPPLRMYGHDFREGRATLGGLAASLGLERWVSIDGPIVSPQKWEELSRASLFVFPSRWEGQGIAMLEAGGIGAPVLTTSSAALGPRLGSEGAAIVVDPSPDAIAGGIQRGLTAAGRDAGTRAAGFVGDNFSWRGIARRILAQLEALGLGR